MNRSMILTLLAVPLLAAALAQPPAKPMNPPAAAPQPGVMPPPRVGVPLIPLQPRSEADPMQRRLADLERLVLYHDNLLRYRFVVYPWVAASPMRCYHWWQYPWYAQPWWSSPWTTYWAYNYYPTPWGYWYLPAPNHYYGPPRGYVPVQRIAQAEPVVGDRSAESLYLEGYDRYFDGDVTNARKLLSAAAGRDANDARVWYFKALAERQLGDEVAAQESARRGAALEYLNGASRPFIAQTLERVQGDTRRFLRSAGTDMTVAKAQEIIAAPVRLATAK